ncbi:MAG TPA: L-threonylcarbamoyladenylate synthase [Gemmatimonadaceae bacterium]|nr:L-threonylcarbamoyladenylate synthase [Gemmatimonadaceae bacterium]
MKLRVVDPNDPDAAVMAEAAEILRHGGVVAFPTETVYGLGAHALDRAAVRRIFEVKGRPRYNPLIVHVASAEAARALATSWPSVADRLAAEFWPGPLTMVVSRQPSVPDEITAGLSSVALRVPAHPVALALLKAAALPIAAPSANRFTEVSPTTAAHVAQSLGDGVDMLIDGGPTRVGIESTVVDLSGHAPTILRPGMISREHLRAVIGVPLEEVTADPVGDAPRPSPGMTERHYAPRAKLRLFDSDARVEAEADAAAAVKRGQRLGALVRGAFDVEGVHVERLPEDPAGYARALYAALHALDDAGCEVVWLELVPDGDEWAGVRDRLRRAAR